MITVAEAAERLGVHDRTIRRWIREGRLKPYRTVGSTKRCVSVDEVEALHDPQVVQPPKPYVAACYVVRDSRLLMVRRRFREGTLEWAGPSGNILPDESAEQAAVRECREELGIEVEVLRRLGDRIHPATDRHLIYLACRVVSGEPTIIDREAVAAMEWVPIPEALERWANLKGGVYPPVREYLEALTTPAESMPGEQEEEEP